MHLASSLSDCTTILTLKVSKATGWYYSWGNLDRNLIYQNLSAGCYKTLLFSLSKSDSQPGLADSPAIPVG